MNYELCKTHNSDRCHNLHRIANAIVPQEELQK